MNGWPTLPTLPSETEGIFICPDDLRNPIPLAGFLHCRDRGFSEFGGSRDIPFDTEGFRCRLSTAVPRTTPDSYGLEFESTDYWDHNDLRSASSRNPTAGPNFTAFRKTLVTLMT